MSQDIADALGGINETIQQAFRSRAETKALEADSERKMLDMLAEKDDFNALMGNPTNLWFEQIQKIQQKDKEERKSREAFGAVIAGTIGLTAVLALPVIGFNAAKNAWTEYHREKYPDIALATTNDKRIFFGAGLNTASAQKAALNACKQGTYAGTVCHPMERAFQTDSPGYVAVAPTIVSRIPFSNAAAPPYFATFWTGKVGEDDITKLRQSCVLGQINGKEPCTIGPVEYFANTEDMKQQVDSLRAHLAKEESFVRDVLSSAPKQLPTAPATAPTPPAAVAPQRVPAPPSAPAARTTMAPAGLSFQQQLEYYGLSGNGKEPTYEGRLVSKRGRLMANADGNYNADGTRSLLRVNEGTCVLAVNFGQAVFNAKPIYVPVTGANGEKNLIGGWYVGKLGQKCDI